jgi:hypothetical protein
VFDYKDYLRISTPVWGFAQPLWQSANPIMPAKPHTTAGFVTHFSSS